MAKLLVTGGAGFIGTNFVRYWRSAHSTDAVTILDALTYAGRRENLADLNGINFVHANICDDALVAKLLMDHGIDTIVHFAAESHVDRSIAGPDAFIQTNVLGTHALLKAAKRVWLDSGSGKPHRFHHVSTDEVYGTLAPEDPAFTETTAYAPNSPYAASKAASDHLVRAYSRTFGLNTTISNCSNNYGPYQFPEKLIPLFITNALFGRPLPIYGDGQNVRDWLHVEDHCRAIDLILERGQNGEVYNVGGGHETSNLKIVETICSSIDRVFAQDLAMAKRYPDAPAAKGKATASLKRFVPDRLGHDRRYAINSAKIERELGYQASNSDFAVGFPATLAWYLHNDSWWSSFRKATDERVALP
jgi:dTDP-glucose 4,6-dehydratase